MDSVGNKIANSYYENRASGVMGINSMSSDHQRKRYITDKYQKN